MNRNFFASPWWIPALSMAMAAAVQGQVNKPVEEVEVTDAIILPVTKEDEAWSQLVGAINGVRGGNDAAASAEALRAADLAKAFYTKNGKHPQAVEARKLEALLLVEAADKGGAGTKQRAASIARSFRRDASVPVADRAVVAGTYDFTSARERIGSPADMDREYEAVARGLINEFPDQPQGYVSLLTLAGGRDVATARKMAAEIIESREAPAEVRASARRLVSRLALLGQSVDKVLGEAVLGAEGRGGWQKGRAGVVYIWASGTPESLALGKLLAGRKLDEVNVVGLCLDRDAEAAAAVAATQGLPGRLYYLPNGSEGEQAIQLGADTAPLLYIVDAAGEFTDVRGIEDLETKLGALGL